LKFSCTTKQAAKKNASHPNPDTLLLGGFAYPELTLDRLISHFTPSLNL
jgi:hypothetical protein